MSKLVLPNANYKDTYLQALKELQQEGRELDKDYGKLQGNFEEFVQVILNRSKGKDLPEGWVPYTQYWLIDDGEYIGATSIRHALTDSLLKIGGHIGYHIRPSKRNKGYGKKILALALFEAKKMGFEKVLVTCDETNIGSKKIIEANGGVLENSVTQDNGLSNKLRYWIQIQ